MKHNVFLSLGSNVGDREEYLKMAVKEISSLENVELHKISDIYETEPWGYSKQQDFLNIAVSIYTKLDAEVLLKELQNIEKFLNRKSTIKWGPRTIDIDILLFDFLKLNLEHLKIPHPLMFERAFVLVPLKEIYEGDEIFGVNIDEMINKYREKQGVRHYKEFEFLP